jgi:Patatin-like phospholipase
MVGSLALVAGGAAVVGSAAVSAGGRMLCTVYEVDAPKVRDTYSGEWKFNHRDVSSPPMLGISMSGGGIRSAAFNLGVLNALHDKAILRDVDVMSAVSGGSYAMSWYLLQSFYAAKAAEREHRDFRLDDEMHEMFRPDGRHQAYLCREPRVVDWSDMGISVILDATIGQVLRALAASSGLVGQYNNGLIRRAYREHLQRLFQGLPSAESEYKIANEIDSRARQELMLDASDFSYVIPVNYRELAAFAQQYRLPYFIFNATVLVQRAYRHMLWPTAFEFTAHDVGSDVCGYRTWDALRKWEVSKHISEGMSLWRWGLVVDNTSEKDLRRNRWVLMVNLAPAISGAAIGLSYFNPKKSSRAVKLATWTPFVSNLDLGYIFDREIWNEKGTLYVSDGGHCENLGAYALIKRQCRRIIIVDAEHEATVPYIFAGYAKLKQQLAQEMHLGLAVPDIDSYPELANATANRVDQPQR